MSDGALTEHIGPTLSGDALTALADLVRLDPAARAVEIVDVGASPLVGEPPAYRGLLDAGLARVTTFEPDPASLAALQEASQGDPTHRHLGDAVGDGGDHTLSVCSAGGFSSLLRPDAEQLAVLTDFPRLAEVVDTRTVSTVRLDDLDLGPVDLLALDVQGSEPAVVDGGSSVLGTVFAVQAEMGFHRLYEEGPTFADLDTRLRSAGLVPHMVVSSRTWPLAPIGWDDPLQAFSRHLVETDMLYVRDPAHLDRVSDESLRAGTLIACAAYGSMGLGLLCITELARRGRLDPDAPTAYRALVMDALDLFRGETCS